MALTLEFGEQIDVRWCESCGAESGPAPGMSMKTTSWSPRIASMCMNTSSTAVPRLLVMLRDFEGDVDEEGEPPVSSSFIVQVWREGDNLASGSRIRLQETRRS